jgi:cytochrome c oxidase cbb3-type subunit II
VSRLDYHYQTGPVGALGPVIPWLSDEQRAMFLREGLVEEIDDGDSSRDDGEAALSAADNCIAALERLNVPADAGAPACRTALRDAGFRFGNAAIAAAVKRRKAKSELSATADS